MLPGIKLQVMLHQDDSCQANEQQSAFSSHRQTTASVRHHQGSACRLVLPLLPSGSSCDGSRICKSRKGRSEMHAVLRAQPYRPAICKMQCAVIPDKQIFSKWFRVWFRA